MDNTAYVLITHQPGAIGGAETNAYGPVSKPEGELSPQAALDSAGHLLADGASPPMKFWVLPLQPAKWGEV